MTEVALTCRCGTVQGAVSEAETGNRLVCYCDDCQAFAERLQAEDALDDCGGTELLQVAPCQIRITAGNEQLRSLRLKPKGLIRWYAGCCNTPLANTVSGGVPFVGLIHSCVDCGGNADTQLGPIKYYVQGQFAKKPPAVANVHKAFPLTLLLQAVPNLLWAKMRGRDKPSPFFHADGQPVSDPVLSESH